LQIVPIQGGGYARLIFSASCVHRYDIWLDNYHGLPVKVISYAPDGQRLETVLLDAMVINTRFPVNFFTP
jgi:negative regulator of sigma E activity